MIKSWPHQCTTNESRWSPKDNYHMTKIGIQCCNGMTRLHCFVESSLLTLVLPKIIHCPKSCLNQQLSTLYLRFISEKIQMSIGEGSKLISHCCKCKSQKHNFLFTDFISSWNLGKLVWESCHLELSAVCHQLKGITNRMSQAPASNLASSCPNFGTMNRISEANCETSAGPRGCALIGRTTYGFWPMRGLGQGASIWGKAWGILCRKLHNQICCHFIGGALIIPLMLKLRQHLAACCFMASKSLRTHCRANQLNSLAPEKKTQLDFQKCFLSSNPKFQRNSQVCSQTEFSPKTPMGSGWLVVRVEVEAMGEVGAVSGRSGRGQMRKLGARSSDQSRAQLSN